MNWVSAFVVACIAAVAVAALVLGVLAMVSLDQRGACPSGCDPDPVPGPDPGPVPDPTPCSGCPHLACDDKQCTLDRPLNVRGTVSAQSAVENNGPDLVPVPVFGDRIGLRLPPAVDSGEGWVRPGLAENGKRALFAHQFNRTETGGLNDFYNWGLCSGGSNATAPERGAAKTRCQT